ncbi:MAG TPA: hypothetical protein VIV12_14675, partial [Streptosporangiaceae bacterium]
MRELGVFFRVSLRMMLRARGTLYLMAATPFLMVLYAAMRNLSYATGGQRQSFVDFIVPGKGLALLWRRRAITLTAIVLQGFLYLMIQLFIGGGHLVLPVLGLTLPGLFAYAVAGAAALQGSGGIAEEVNGGTLEQVHLAPARPSVLVGGRLAALAVEGLIPAVVLALAFGLGYGPHWVIRPDALVPLALTITDALGYGLLMTALTLRLASIGAVVHVFNMAVMFFGGMFIPVTLFPHGVQ